jgi:hypothetical protein
MRDVIGWASDIAGLAQVAGAVGFALFSLFVWRSKFRRYRPTKVFFPKDVDEFIEYYAKCIREARSVVCVTSDGFNMKNPASAARAKKMRSAMVDFMSRGGKVYRYQMLDSMHINWLVEIGRLAEEFPDSFITFYNRKYESVGSFCVIDPGTRKTVYEYMLPHVGYLGQGTEPSDFGFIHGHQHKSDKAFERFDQVQKDPGTVVINSKNWIELAESLWTMRIRSSDAFDPEIIAAQRRGSSDFQIKVFE